MTDRVAQMRNVLKATKYKNLSNARMYYYGTKKQADKFVNDLEQLFKERKNEKA